MTVSSTATFVRLAGNGSANSIATTFPVFDEDDLVVTSIDANGIPSVLTLTTDYSVAIDSITYLATVTLVSTPATGITIDVRSNTVLSQPASFRNLGRYMPEIHEEAFDRLSRQIQDVDRQVKQSFRYPDNVTTDAVMSSLENWEEKYLFVNSAGVIEPATSLAGGALTQSTFDALLPTTTATLPSTQVKYDRTDAEIAAGVTPTDYSFPELYPLRYGTNIAAIQAAIDVAAIIATSTSGQVGVKVPAGTWSGTTAREYLNVKANVIVYGAGYGTLLSQAQTAGTTANDDFVYLKDYAQIRDLRIKHSDYVKQSGGADYIAWHKQGITTQGAATGQGIRISNIGFSQCNQSMVYQHDAHHGMIIEGCYTWGNLPGGYVDVDGDGLVTDWTATRDAARLAAGTQVYVLSNFFNNGTGSYDCTIRSNFITDISDSFVANNTGAFGFKCYDNTCIKGAGYYGGYGLDFNGGTGARAWGNTFEGFSYGAYFHAGAVKNSAWENTFKAASGIVFEGASTINNRAHDNDCIVSTYGTVLGYGAGIAYFAAGSNECNENTIDGQTTSASTLTITACANNGSGLIRVTSAAHGLLKRRVVKITGVTGTAEANGVWEVSPVDGDADKFDLLRSVYTNAYVSGGSVAVGTVGIAVTKGSGANTSGGRAVANKIRSCVRGFLGPDSSNALNEYNSRFESVTTNYDASGVLTNRLVRLYGLSSGDTPSNNLTGSMTVSDAATSVAVTFTNTEVDTNYQILFSIRSVSGSPAAGAYVPAPVSSKTTGGFTFNVTAAPGAGTSVSYNWLLIR